MTKDNIALAAVFKTAVPGTDTNKQVADLFRRVILNQKNSYGSDIIAHMFFELTLKVL